MQSIKTPCGATYYVYVLLQGNTAWLFRWHVKRVNVKTVTRAWLGRLRGNPRKLNTRREGDDFTIMRVSGLTPGARTPILPMPTYLKITYVIGRSFRRSLKAREVWASHKYQCNHYETQITCASAPNDPYVSSVQQPNGAHIQRKREKVSYRRWRQLFETSNRFIHNLND